MQFVPFAEGIEVNGQTAWSIVAGFKAFSVLASTYLLEEGIGTLDRDGVALVEPEAWYPQRAWLKAFEKISAHMGDAVLFEIGKAIPHNAVFPPSVKDIHTAIQAIDIAYHLNHRKQGQLMFDPATGSMLEGIGHYGYERLEGQNRIISVCENPYPCAFDRGILTCMAERFEPSVQVVHDETRPCRKRGGNSCTYLITWK
ncbi:hypothetical protein ACN28E_27010 [Archangium lansingense]|uniref:hypothetical protein n=1 Tax=Archangium lansingense TaxID=2995310 RepID=UPI003B8158AF